MKNSIYTFLSLLFSLSALAQTPAHFILGANELDGIHIYSLHQDLQLNYWIGTNNGLYKYDGYEFTNIRFSEMLSPSLFGIKSDQNGAVYCHNLSGQIFKVENDTGSLFFEIPDSLLSSVFEIAIDKNDRFFVSTHTLFEITKDKKIIILGNFISNPAIFYQTSDGNLHGLGMNGMNQVDGFTIAQDSLIRTHYKISQKDSNEIEKINLFQVEDQAYLFECFTGIIYSIHEDSLVQISQLNVNNNQAGIFRTGEQFWIANNSIGLTQFSNLEKPDSNQLQLFKDFKVSSFVKDNEGNILFGTFKDGIIVVPESKISTLNLGDLNERINLITSDQRGHLIFGTNIGEVGSYELASGKIEMFDDFSQGSIEFLEFLTHHDELLIGGLYSILLDPKSRESMQVNMGSLKDLSPIRHQQYLVSTNVNTFIYAPSGVHFDPYLSDKKEIANEGFMRSIYKGRCYANGFDSLSSSMYISTSLGLKRIKSDTTIDLYVDKHPVLGRDILFFNDRIYVATDKDGVLIYKSDSLVEQWTAENRLASNHTQQIMTNGRLIFINTDKGVQVTTEEGETKWLINKSEGLITNHIIDMVVSDKELLILNQRGIQRIDLEYMRTSTFKPNIRFNSIKMNDSLVSVNDKVNQFPYFQNKFSVDFGSISLKNRNEIQYRYRLLGVEKEWQKNEYISHKVDYKTLPPGEYEFQVKAIWRNHESEMLRYRFVIASPFWLKWWFYAIIIIALFALIFFYFFRLMRNQQRKSRIKEELYESKLTAIQAQMNPHFIFNSLNSIQDLVLKNDAENAYIYISKFALLVRNTLTHSDKDFIDFADEIKALNLYLTLEKLRFKSAFEFTIEAPEDLDIQLPPMLIQPFIENSLIHGLLHKTGQKKLAVTFHVEDAIICCITDNGIGRKEAKMIQERQFSAHESFAISAIKKRLSLLEYKFGGDYSVEYIDLEEEGMAIGTKVIIRIPFLKDY